jgi:hypothetical protein
MARFDRRDSVDERSRLSTYAELKARSDGAPVRSAWDVLGLDTEANEDLEMLREMIDVSLHQ